MSTSSRPGGLRISGRFSFLFVILVCYAVCGLVEPTLTGNALLYFLSMLRKVIPILAMVFVTMILVNTFLDPRRIQQHLGTESGVRGWFYAVLAGIVISGPPFVLYPMLGDLQRHGARNALLATMLYNRNVKIQFLPAMVYYFGLHYTVILSVYIIVFSLLNGKLLEFFVCNEKTDI